jgi:hypothetical protein
MKQIKLEKLINDIQLPINMLRELALTNKSGLISKHHTIGRHIRNEYKLWEYEIINEKSEIIHADDASMIIIESIWESFKIDKVVM